MLKSPTDQPNRSESIRNTAMPQEPTRTPDNKCWRGFEWRGHGGQGIWERWALEWALKVG